MTPEERDAFVDFAVTAAAAAGAAILPHFRASITVTDKGGARGYDPVTEADRAAESVIRTTAKLSGDLGRAARGLVEGAIETAKELGVDASEAAATAATAATRAAADIGGTAGAKVREAVVGTIQGVKVILKEPFEESGTPRIRPGPIDRRR